MDRHPRACWFAAIPGAQKAKDVEDCLKNTAAPPHNRLETSVRGLILKLSDKVNAINTCKHARHVAVVEQEQGQGGGGGDVCESEGALRR